MTLQDFLNDFDQHLKEYGEKKAAEQASTKNNDKLPPEFFQYMAAYMTEGSSPNLAIKQATKILLKDEVFIERMTKCMEYVVAMTMAAALSNNNEEEKDET